jgi:hypothetical protein
MIPARYVTQLHYIEYVEAEIEDYAMALLDCGMPLSELILLLDELFPILLPVTHRAQWTLLNEEGKNCVISLMYDYSFRWTPTEEDLAIIDANRVEERLGRKTVLMNEIMFA